MNGALRRKLAGWVEFYGDMEIDLIDRRRAVAGENPPAASLRKVVEEPDTPAGPAPMKGAPPPSAPKPVNRFAPPPGSLGAPGSLGPALSPGLFDEPTVAPQEDSLERIRADLGDCRRCKLSNHRNLIVFGTGNPNAELVFVGEAPGADEDEQGLPFVGRAGKLLNRLIDSVGMKREQVYICNIIKCRPPGNRTPEKDEIESCKPFVLRQIEAVRPRLLCCLGAPALRTMLPFVKEGITKVRGQLFDYHGFKLMPTFHPAYILRNPREEGTIRKDFIAMAKFLGVRGTG